RLPDPRAGEGSALHGPRNWPDSVSGRAAREPLSGTSGRPPFGSGGATATEGVGADSPGRSRAGSRHPFRPVRPPPGHRAGGRGRGTRSLLLPGGVTPLPCSGRRSGEGSPPQRHHRPGVGHSVAGGNRGGPPRQNRTAHPSRAGGAAATPSGPPDRHAGGVSSDRGPGDSFAGAGPSGAGDPRHGVPGPAP